MVNTLESGSRGKHQEGMSDAPADLETSISVAVPPPSGKVWVGHPKVNESCFGRPLITVLNYSGGKQSSALLWMVLRGELGVNTDHFIVLNADPGMENSLTYEYNEMMRDECRDVGIHFETVEGPSLYHDILNLKNTNSIRLDCPPYWTKDSETGKRGRLLQRCTKHYKIAPMDRAVRRILEERFGIGQHNRRLGYALVEKWVGFSYDEVLRIKPPDQKYLYFRYPLVEMRMDRVAVEQYYLDRDLPMPPRSVCNACFANSADFYRSMKHTRPKDWQQAVAVDNAVRDWSQIMVKHPVFVSHTLIPLEDLLSQEPPDEGDQSGWGCDSGYCFT